MKRKILIGAFIIFMTAPFLLNNYSTSYTYPTAGGRLSGGADSLPQSFADSVWKEGMEKMTITESTPHSLKNRNKKEIILADSLPRNEPKFKMKKSPLTAVMLSAILPGAGQFYNQSFWKIPVITGLVGYFGYEYFKNNNTYKDYRDRYNASISPENQFGDLNLKTLREFYRDQRNDFVWYFIIVYAANLIDAFVDAHLFDFDVKDNNYTPTGLPDRTYRLKLNFSF